MRPDVMTISKRHSRSLRRGRRGSIYVFVLGVGTMLAVAGISMITLSQISIRSAGMSDDAIEASVLAESAVEAALLNMTNNSNWRTDYTNNVESSQRVLGHGTISFKFVDESDANLSNGTSDPVRVYGLGRVRRSTRVYSVLCAPRGMTSLSTGMSFDQALTLGSVSVYGTATISSNGLMTCTGSTFTGTNLESAGLVTTALCTGTGARKSLVSAKEMPNSATVFNLYQSIATRMSGVSTSGGSGYQINRVLISPLNNPYSGGINTAGLYYIDCGGSSITITDSRIVGTLILRNCGGLTLQGAVNGEPSMLGYPVLMVEGNLNWKTNGNPLLESDSPATNFNPSGIPYPYNLGAGGGTANTTQTDSYPNQISGLIYVSGGLTTSGAPVLNKGVLLCAGAWSAAGSMSLRFDDTYYNNPAPGFTSTTLIPQSGTWQWEQAP